MEGRRETTLKASSPWHSLHAGTRLDRYLPAELSVGAVLHTGPVELQEPAAIRHPCPISRPIVHHGQPERALHACGEAEPGVTLAPNGSGEAHSLGARAGAQEVPAAPRSPRYLLEQTR